MRGGEERLGEEKRGGEGRREDNMLQIRLRSDTISYQQNISKTKIGLQDLHKYRNREGKLFWHIEACQMSLNGDIDYKSITVIY